MTAISGVVPLSVVNALAIGKRSRGAAMGLMFYDHIITLGLEIDLVWRQNKRRPAFFLYIFNRFFAFLWLIFDSVPLTKSGTNSSHVCVIYLMCDDLVTMVTTLTVQGILQLRVYALYNRSKRILVFLLTMCAIEVAVMATLIAVTIGHLNHLPVASTSTGCYYHGFLGIGAVFWAPGLVYEPILFLLVLYKAWPTKQTIRVPLVTRIARDSLFYFVVIFAGLLLSTIIWAHYPTWINLVMPWSAALPSILGSRLLLNMREAALHREDGSYFLESFTAGPASWPKFRGHRGNAVDEVSEESEGTEMEIVEEERTR